MPHSRIGKIALIYMVEMREFPIDFHQFPLKSEYVPIVKPKLTGYSDMSAFTSMSRNAVLKKSMRKVKVVIFERSTVSEEYPKTPKPQNPILN